MIFCSDCLVDTVLHMQWANEWQATSTSFPIIIKERQHLKVRHINGKRSLLCTSLHSTAAADTLAAVGFLMAVVCNVESP